MARVAGGQVLDGLWLLAKAARVDRTRDVGILCSTIVAYTTSSPMLAQENKAI